MLVADGRRSIGDHRETACRHWGQALQTICRGYRLLVIGALLVVASSVHALDHPSVAGGQRLATENIFAPLPVSSAGRASGRPGDKETKKSRKKKTEKSGKRQKAPRPTMRPRRVQHDATETLVPRPSRRPKKALNGAGPGWLPTTRPSYPSPKIPGVCDIYVRITKCASANDSSISCDAIYPSTDGTEDTRCNHELRFTIVVENISRERFTVTKALALVGNDLRDILLLVAPDGTIPVEPEVSVEVDMSVNICAHESHSLTVTVGGVGLSEECEDVDKFIVKFPNIDPIPDQTLVPGTKPTCSPGDLDDPDRSFQLRPGRKKTCRWLVQRPNQQRRRLCRRKKAAKQSCPASCSGSCLAISPERRTEER